MQFISMSTPKPKDRTKSKDDTILQTRPTTTQVHYVTSIHQFHYILATKQTQDHGIVDWPIEFLLI